jgi:hypothetical protein
MSSTSLRAGGHARAYGAVRPRAIEHRLRRYRPRFNKVVCALAGRHARLAELAVSFPALLFALAVPRRGFAPEPVIERAIEGAPLVELGDGAGLPLWLRKLPPEAFVEPLPTLPDGELFRRRIANHLPRSIKLAPTWLRAVARASEWAHEPLALWIARELTGERRGVDLNQLRRISLFAWFSARPGTRGHAGIERPWAPAMHFAAAGLAADGWLRRRALELNIGDAPIADIWLKPASVDGYDFVPLRSAVEIAEEASAMRNCLHTYGPAIAHNRVRLWSVRKSGRRVATLSVHRDPLPYIEQLRAAENEPISVAVWRAAGQWLYRQEPSATDVWYPEWNTAPLDRLAWISLWRPYWLAKRRIPAWLPLTPSRTALREL